MRNRFYYKKNGEVTLEDRDISNAICGAQMDFDDGAIIECADALAEILEALNEFIKQEENNGN